MGRLGSGLSAVAQKQYNASPTSPRGISSVKVHFPIAECLRDGKVVTVAYDNRVTYSQDLYSGYVGQSVRSPYVLRRPLVLIQMSLPRVQRSASQPSYYTFG
jgi:hypothetical protein